jgi:hypothetical protein
MIDRTLLIAVSFLFLSMPVQAKEKLMILSWGDVIWQHKGEGTAQLDTPEKVAEAARIWKERGVDRVLFRADDFRVLLFHRIRPGYNNPYIQEWLKTTKRAWEQGLLEVAVKAIHEQGMKVDMWITIFDEGCPEHVLYSDSDFFSWQSHFTRENPHVLSADRSLTANQRKYHWGVMEYAYPEARGYMLSVIRAFSDPLDFDGVFLSVRSHSPPAEHADQFGFNEPVVKEFQRRYGRNILQTSFDLEQWRELRGEYLTQFLGEVKEHLRKKRQTLSIGVAQGDYIGPPFGNMKLQWRRWISEGIIDSLVVGHITNERARYPNRTQRAMGYIQNQEEDMGLPSIEDAVRLSYGPLCQRFGVGLYLAPGSFRMSFRHPAYGRGSQTPEVRKSLFEAFEKEPSVTGIVYGYGSVMEER